ncbi:ATP-binding protein [Xenophilus arseniciresistens]|uniref:histidine kinase n=1 Tax=Xenophilus arseniciresistens TaxID=1283306 RepID=A0AAE3N5N5_9BURK|nr:PAS domain-containing sensor histidine kinase [Xenophilus arseniciresistens]MDA7415014.1 ATP-binding protein [Xenophilus arseniciresistens]
MSAAFSNNFPAAPGPMSEAVRAFDWSGTPLGPIAQWPVHLRIPVEMMLASHFPKCIVWGESLTMIYNDAFKVILGNKPDTLGRSFAQAWAEAWDAIEPFVTRTFAGEAVFIEDFPLQINRHGYAEQAHFTFCYSPLRDEQGRIVGLIDTVMETTSKFLATERLERWVQSQDELIAQRTADRDRMWRLSTDLMLICDRSTQIRQANPAWERLLGWSTADLLGRPLAWLLHPQDREVSHRVIPGLPESGASFRFETRCRARDGAYHVIEWSTVPDEQLLLLVGRDVSAERSAAEALRASEAALHHAQKMESVGKLTGGVAHDFNNLLHVISGNLQLLSRVTGGNPSAERHLATALESVKKGAKLASQLLAFARKQPLEPEVLNIGRLIPGIEDMLRRTLGESVEVEAVISGELWNCFVDAAQMENALLNLAINGRDAMQGVGQLTIECANAHLDDAYARLHDDVEPGQYVMVAVSDTGVGMSPQLMAQVFEPFFTTKEEGRGSGLGLSMVYGFVKQSGGHVKLYSEPGHGTTVKLYLPRSMEPERLSSGSESTRVLGGHETVLVAEDDDAVRETVSDLLQDLGYEVLSARDAASAMAILESGVQVDLLFTDVVMPGRMRSTELASLARQRRPELAVLFTSGYTENAIDHGGRLDAGVELIGKPYTREALALKVRSVLARQRTQRQI